MVMLDVFFNNIILSVVEFSYGPLKCFTKSGNYRGKPKKSQPVSGKLTVYNAIFFSALKLG